MTNRLHAFVLLALMMPLAASAQVVLRYSDHEPLGGMRTRFLQEVVFPGIEKASQGRLKIEPRWGAAVANGYQALAAVGAGQLTDMATVVPEYTAKELPLHQLFKSFPLGPSGGQQVDVLRRAYQEIPAFEAELEGHGAVAMFLGTGYPVAFFGNSPLHRLADVKGQRWRSASFWHQDFLLHAQATPVSMPWGEGIYEALRSKSLDGLMVNVDSAYELKVHEVAPHVLTSKALWLGHVYVLAINRDTWKALAPQDRTAIQSAVALAYEQLGRVMDDSFEAMLEKLTQAGVSLRRLERDELQAWSASTGYRQVQEKWAQDQTARGVKDAIPVLRQLSALLDAPAIEAAISGSTSAQPGRLQP